ncbi:MAG: type II toxin-antitoxin system Phd/YefM family antitoxin [Acidimicrobiia bacterium]
MATHLGERSISVTAASERGVSGLLKDAESGADVVVERHGRPVAAIVSVRRLSELVELEADLRSAALVLARAATDTGQRTDLDEIIAVLGFDRSQLEAELEAERASQR